MKALRTILFLMLLCFGSRAYGSAMTTLTNFNAVYFLVDADPTAIPTNVVLLSGNITNWQKLSTNVTITINPSDNFIPYRFSAMSFADSILYVPASTEVRVPLAKTLSFEGTNFAGVFKYATMNGQLGGTGGLIIGGDSEIIIQPMANQFRFGVDGSLVDGTNTILSGTTGWTGTGTNYLSDNGTYTLPFGDRFHIASTNWDDSQVPEAMVRVGATAPTLGNFNGGPAQTLQFQNNRDDTIMATAQMTHRWKQGTDIHPHVHWCETAATGAGTNIVWQLTYTWTNIGCAYPAYTTASITNSVTGTNWLSQLSEFPPISGSGKLVSSIFVFELKRLANTATADDYNQSVAFLGFDLHHQVDSPGSDSELTKSF